MKRIYDSLIICKGQQTIAQFQFDEIILDKKYNTIRLSSNGNTNSQGIPYELFKHNLRILHKGKVHNSYSINLNDLKK